MNKSENIFRSRVVFLGLNTDNIQIRTSTHKHNTHTVLNTHAHTQLHHTKHTPVHTSYWEFLSSNAQPFILPSPHIPSTLNSSRSYILRLQQESRHINRNRGFPGQARRLSPLPETPLRATTTTTECQATISKQSGKKTAHHSI